jgi:hypothetical protein
MKTTGKLIIFVFALLALTASAYAADDSPLFEAAKKGGKAAVEALLAKGADVNPSNAASASVSEFHTLNGNGSTRYAEMLWAPERDQKLRELLTERHAAAVEILRTKQKQNDLGMVSVEELIHYIQRASETEIDLAEDPKQLLKALENKVDLIKDVEKQYDVRSTQGTSRKVDGQIVAYWLRTANIELYRARRHFVNN